MRDPRSAMLLTILAAAALAVSADQNVPRPEDPGWPQFRGPQRDGVSGETGLLDRWPADGPARLWRIAVGPGYSGVSVVGDRAYTAWQQDGAQWLVSLDARTGVEAWRQRIGASYENPYGDGPRATPIVHGQVVIVVSAGGELHVVGRDGKPIWNRDLRSLGAAIPSMGYASTPIVEQGRIIVESGGAAAFVAFDLASGETAWRAGSDAAAYSSPIAITLDGVRQVVFFSGGGLHAVSPRDGSALWDYPWRSLCPASGVPLNSASPIHVPPDRILITSGYGGDSGAALIRIVRDKEGRFRPETVWRNEVLDSRINSPILLDGHVYGFRGSTFAAVDAASGEERWRASGFQRGSVIGADGKLIVLGELGRLALVEASAAAYRELASTAIFEDRTWTPPSLAGGRLFLRDSTSLVCLDLAGGRRAGSRE